MDKLGPRSVYFWRQSKERAPGWEIFISGVLNVINHMPRDVHLYQTHGSLQSLCHSPCPLGTLLNLSRPQVPLLENEVSSMRFSLA